MSKIASFLSLAVAVWVSAALLASCKSNSTSPSYGNTGGGAGARVPCGGDGLTSGGAGFHVRPWFTFHPPSSRR